MTMKFSLALPIDHVQYGAEFIGPDAIREMSVAAEALGFDALNVTDHPAPTANWMKHGGHHAQDPFVMLAMVAAHTKKIRLHTYLLVIPYRNPFVAARSIASLDAFSGGRFLMSAGVGYLKGEFKTLNIDFDKRQEIFDETIAAMKAAWASEEFTFEGEFFKAGGNVIQPSPTQKPHPPIWIGGNAKLSIRRAVDYGDGWSPMFGGGSALAQTARTAEISTIEDLAERVQYMRDYAAEKGRTAPLDLCVSPPVSLHNPNATMSQVVDGIGKMVDLGANWCSLSAGGATRAEWLKGIEKLSKEVVEKVNA
jgi:probable F420-dependent oxidoreductase